MQFDKLVESEFDECLLPELNYLLELKKTLPEIGRVPKIQIFNDYIEKIMLEIKDAADKIKETRKDWGTLNELFLQFVNNY